MLEIKNITKKFGGVIALNQCSFTVPRNKITALIGPNGAGKTTLFDVISGLVEPDEGEILIDNQPLIRQRPYQIAQLGIARTWQQVRLFKYLTILDHLQLAESDENTKLLKSMVSSPKDKAEQYQNTLVEFGLDPTTPRLRGASKPRSMLDTPVSELSYGQRKLLQLAMVMLRSHRLLLLDEPVAGVNAVVQERVEQLLLAWKEKNETIVVVEHDIEFVKRLADYVVVLDQGRVLVDGKPAEALQDSRVVDAYLGA